MFWEIEDELSSREREVAGHLERIGKFFVFLRKVRGDLFDESFQRQLMTAYAPRGTDPVPPALMAMVTLLQAYDDRGDADAVVTAKLDRRWQLVLGTLEQEELKAPFGQGSLPRFRERMAAAGLLDALRERTIALARESKLFGWKQLKATFDSSPLIGAGRVEDTYNLIGHAMRDLLRHLANVRDEPFEDLAKTWGLDALVASSVKASLDIRWEDAEERERGLRMLLEQAQRLLLRTEGYLAGNPEDNQAVELAGLLLRVIDQDTDPDPDGRRSLRHGVAKDRICSVGDPEMRHGHKSETRSYDGYQRHIVRGVEVPLIFGVHVQPANQAECEATEALLEQLPENVELAEVWCDRGYLGSHELLGMVRRGLKLHAKPWTYRGRKGRFSKDAFSIDWEAQTAECPNGVVKKLPQGGGTVYFGKACRECPLREQCTTNKKGRSLRIHPYDDVLQALKADYASKETRQTLRLRSRAEHSLAHVEQTQGRRARYKGCAKNNWDLNRTAAIINLQAIQRADEQRPTSRWEAAA